MTRVTDVVARPPLVLVAEDNEDNRIIATTILRHAGYRVIEASCGTDVLQLARSELPDLILMDVGMPDIDGWTATRTLREDPSTAGVKILAFTAHALPADRLHAIEVGCDGYLAKPVPPDVLLKAVDGVLGRTRETESFIVPAR
jgi:two-component system, cell cycle response regulator DivK